MTHTHERLPPPPSMAAGARLPEAAHRGAPNPQRGQRCAAAQTADPHHGPARLWEVQASMGRMGSAET